MNYYDIRAVRAEAEAQIEQADNAVRGAVHLIAGRLRAARPDPDALRQIKAELQNFNAVTGKWKDAK